MPYGSKPAKAMLSTAARLPRRKGFYIIEHPTKGVLRDLEETDSGRVGRWARDGYRGQEDLVRFPTIERAVAARAKITNGNPADCQVRYSEFNPDNYLGAWPVVA